MTNAVHIRAARRSGFTLRFIKAREGATAIEFALVAGPFFLLLMGVIEIALFFFASTMIETATNEAARDVRTGEVLVAGDGPGEFRNRICARVGAIADCSRLQVDVRRIDSFSAAQLGALVSDEGVDTTGFGFDPGGPGDIVVIRAVYEWPLIAPGMLNGMANLPGNKRLIVAASAFRNEPFEV
ncbi:pilus assembly protein [Alkalicaulis satelles]|uniref:Pilus assembly protein n=1 Tax=Alkalicaulis satelles TaxID=2609175 RepID=A0A5M6ZBW1_9PROT|nr:TadE/TadG family type IV pilus assembly protein [Alkalicaulis satelles]KAA5802216.1 pilus assembly protein [Alkalicaulis satelles]